MNLALILLLCCQTPEAKDPLLGIRAKWHRVIEESLPVLQQLARAGRNAELEAEFAKIEKLFDRAGDAEGKLVAMSELLVATANEAHLLRIHLGGDRGRAHELAIRKICLPYASDIVTRDLPNPGHPELHEAQLTSFLSILDDTVHPDSLKELKSHRELRVSHVSLLIKIWVRVAKSRVTYERDYSDALIDEIEHGETMIDMPAVPKSLRTVPFISGQSPDAINDPKIRAEYKAYLQERKDVMLRFHLASTMLQVKKRWLPHFRRSLERLFGSDRTTWDELRTIVDETVEDKEIAQQVLKDLIRKKNP